MKIIIGLSGGIDSLITTYLLKKRGYNVVGVFLKIFKNNYYINKNINNIKKIANLLKIQYCILDIENEFKNKIINYFIKEYLNAKTPNPCIICNYLIKWKFLLKIKIKINANYIATGHYAKIIKIYNRYTLQIANDINKDQTYFLYKLTQFQLINTLMPLGFYKKTYIRKIAQYICIYMYNKKDSQNICFLFNKYYGNFIKNNIRKKIYYGNCITEDGKIVGKHKGIIYYTIGQKIKTNLKVNYPIFVKEIHKKNNEIIICKNKKLFKNKLICYEINFMSINDFNIDILVKAKIRYTNKYCLAIIHKKNKNIIEVIFNKPQRAITVGQSVVFYDNQNCIICGGIILH